MTVAAGLAPQRELLADDRVLVDARLDLGRPEDRRVGREAVDPRRRRSSAGPLRAATQRDHVRPARCGTIGWRSRNSASDSPGMRMIT